MMTLCNGNVKKRKTSSFNLIMPTADRIITELESSSSPRKSCCTNPTHVHFTRESVCIELHRLAYRFLHAFHQRCDFSARHVAHFDREITVSWKLMADYCLPIQAIGTALTLPESIWESVLARTHSSLALLLSNNGVSPSEKETGSPTTDTVFIGDH